MKHEIWKPQTSWFVLNEQSNKSNKKKGDCFQLGNEKNIKDPN